MDKLLETSVLATLTGFLATDPFESIRAELSGRPPGEIPVGLPQGSPLSPVLSSQYLQTFLLSVRERYPSVKFCVYADDMIFYSDDDDEFSRFSSELREFMKEYGLVLAEAKSQISKHHGNWVSGKRLKFLGLVYLPDTDTLKSETRSGRTLPYTFETLIGSTNEIIKLGAKEDPETPTKSAHSRMLLTFLNQINMNPLSYFLSLGGFRTDKYFKRYLND